MIFHIDVADSARRPKHTHYALAAANSGESTNLTSSHVHKIYETAALFILYTHNLARNWARRTFYSRFGGSFLCEILLLS